MSARTDAGGNARNVRRRLQSMSIREMTSRVMSGYRRGNLSEQRPEEERLERVALHFAQAQAFGYDEIQCEVLVRSASAPDRMLEGGPVHDGWIVRIGIA